MKRVISVIAIILLTSCASEKLNLSPVALFDNETSVKDNGSTKMGEVVVINIRKNVNASEITGLISSFPKIKNDGINHQVVLMKTSLQNYLHAVESGNKKGREKALKKFESAYKNIQKDKKFLRVDDYEVVNRYLTRLKTNVSIIEDLLNGKTIN